MKINVNYNRKKIIIVSIIILVVFVLGIISGIIMHSTVVKKEEERLKKATELAVETYVKMVEAKESGNRNFADMNFFGFTIIIDNGKGYSDYVFMVERTKQVVFKDKVNYDNESNTILNKNKTEYLLLAPNGKREKLAKYTYVDMGVDTIEGVYVVYGNSRMGFITENDPPTQYE